MAGRLLRLFLAAALWLPLQAAAEESQPALVILIDDLGDNLAQGQAAVALPGPLSYAVLPHSPHGPRLARQAHLAGKEVMLHAPMANTHERALGPGALTPDLNRRDFIRVLREDLNSVPQAQGVNNHMGSLLTRQRQPMAWLMEELERQQLFFVDSLTTSDSLAWRLARERGLPWLRRDIFLDHERTPDFVHRQFKKALALARQRGWALAIGHPYPVTLDYLRRALPLLDEMGIRRLTVGALISEQSASRSRGWHPGLTADAVEQPGGRASVFAEESR